MATARPLDRSGGVAVGSPANHAGVNRLLKTCNIVEELPQRLTRRAGALRALAGQGSAVDAVVVVMAEPGGAVLGGDIQDLRTLASYADDVIVHRV